jgi:hypothetical protein
VRLEGLGKLKKKKKFNDFIGNQTRDLPACSIVPQPTTLQRAPSFLDNCTEFNDNSGPLREVMRFPVRKREERKEKENKLIDKIKESVEKETEKTTTV